MTILFVLIVVVLVGISILKPNKTEIHKCNSVKDVVMSVNYGRVYPYYTGMTLKQVKNIVRNSCSDTTKFENTLHLQELIGQIRGVAIPLPPHALISDVYLHLNKNAVVSSITIGVSNLDFMTLVEQLALKFGDPKSYNSHLMTWRDSWMTITLDSVNKYLNIMDERLPNL